VNEGNDKFSRESAPTVKTLLLKIETRHYKHFMQHMVKKLLTDLVQDFEMRMHRHFKTSKNFTVLLYLI
jgi:regulator of sirC expression with transglutaminase-like and TPR domain